MDHPPAKRSRVDSSAGDQIVVIRHGLRGPKCKASGKPEQCDCIDCPRHFKVSVRAICDPDWQREQHVWCEYMFPDTLARPFLDIDRKLPGGIDTAQFSEADVDFTARIVPAIMDRLGDNVADIRAGDIAISSSSGWKPCKKCYVLSYHVVLTRVHCRFDQMGTILQAMNLWHDEHCDVFKYVDTCMYSPRGHALRLIGCIKGNLQSGHYDTRVKVGVTHKDPLDHIIGYVRDTTLLADETFNLAPGTLAGCAKRKTSVIESYLPLNTLPTELQEYFKDKKDELYVGTGQIVEKDSCLTIHCKAGAKYCPFAKRTHHSNRMYYRYRCETKRLTLHCFGSECRGHSQDVPLDVKIEPTFYKDCTDLVGTSDVSVLDTKLSGAFCFVSQLDKDCWYGRTRDDQDVPLWQACSQAPFSKPAMTDVYTYKSRNSSGKVKHYPFAGRVKLLTRDKRLPCYRGASWKPYLIGGKYTPGVSKTQLNTFCGFKFAYRELTDEQLLEVEARLTECEFLPMLDNLVNGQDDPKAVLYHRRIIAHVFQKPYQRTQKEISYMSAQGIGKDSVWSVIIECMGRRFGCLNNSRERAVSRFNSYLESCLIMLMSDLNSSANDSELQEYMKSLISEEDVMIEAKGQDAKMCRCYFQVVRANNTNLEAVSADGRRNVKFDCGHKLSQARYTKFHTHFHPHGVWNDEHLRDVFDYFTNVDISSFDVNEDQPFTRTMRCQRLTSNDKDVVIVRTLLQLLVHGHSDRDCALYNYSGSLCLVESTKLLYDLFCGERRVERETCKKMNFKKRLADMFNVHERRVRVHDMDCLGYMIPVIAVEDHLKEIIPDYDTYVKEGETEYRQEGIEVAPATPMQRLRLFYVRMFA